MAFFGIPFYGVRERFRRDHFNDRLLAESRIEDADLVPTLIAIYEHVRKQMEEYPTGSAQSFLLDVESRGLIDTLLGNVLDYEELRELYGRGIFHGDLIWKFAIALAVLVVVFPVLRFVWIVPPNSSIMTVYWMIGAVIAAGLIVTFVQYTRARNRLMYLLESYTGAHA